MKKAFSYAFSGVQIVLLWCKTTLSLYYTLLLTLSYHWSVYQISNKNPWIKLGFCCNCHNFVQFILMKKMTWSWINAFFKELTFKVSSPQAWTKLIKTNKTNTCSCFTLFTFQNRMRYVQITNSKTESLGLLC